MLACVSYPYMYIFMILSDQLGLFSSTVYRNPVLYCSIKKGKLSNTPRKCSISFIEISGVALLSGMSKPSPGIQVQLFTNA
jgi:hypothetical protein